MWSIYSSKNKTIENQYWICLYDMSTLKLIEFYLKVSFRNFVSSQKILPLFGKLTVSLGLM